MNTRKMLIGAALVIIGLPVALVLIAAVSVYVLNRTNGTIVSSGRKREYLLYVPRSYDRARPTPLVISMHAAALWPAAQMETSQGNRVADEQGFIVVYPADNGGRSWASSMQFPGVRTWAANWARRNRCRPYPIESVVASDVTRVEYTNCAEDAGVVLYTVQRGGHSWPGGKPMPEWIVGPTSRSIDATSQIWAFFREHRLPRK
jgi:poly(3-hydroxybutyrate) depolymerase